MNYLNNCKSKKKELQKQYLENLKQQNNELSGQLQEQKKELQEQYKVQINNLHNEFNYKLAKYSHSEMYPILLKDWYYQKMGEVLDLDNPQTFNEKIQWLKLYDSTPEKTRLADKYLVRNWVKEKIGEEYLIPLLGVWDTFDDINFDELPEQFVLKCNHGSGYNIIVKDKSKLNIDDVRRKINIWMNEDFAFKCGFELHYSAIPRKIIAEKYISPEISNVEIQAWCFGGKIEFISYENCKDTSSPARCVFTPQWQRETFKISPNHYSDFAILPKTPSYLKEFISIVNILCKDFKHVRVDFIEVDGNLMFREMTFTSGSGLSVFSPKSKAYEIGKLIKL